MSRWLNCLSTLIAVALAGASANGQTPLGTAWTYQGQLKDGGNPANEPYDMHFRLYDAPTGGTQLGPIICYNNLSVADGLFTATLDFGDQFAGQERFLEVAIRVDTGLNCADTSGFTTLAPRQKLTAAPNALNADRLDGLDSTAFLQSIPVPLTLSGSGSTHVIRAENSSSSVGASGIYGLATDAASPNYGGRFESNSTMGRAVYGQAGAASGSTVGGYFESASTSGLGVFASASAASGAAYGLSARSNSTSGRAVFGWATAGTGTTYGGYFLSLSPSGYGVFGEASATSGSTYGGYFESDSTAGRGVFGLATAASGTTYAGYFENASTSGRGVYAIASATSGTTYGVYGESNSPAGYAGYFVGSGADALYVENNASGRGIHVVATVDTGVWASTTSGVAGVDGRNASATGRGVYGYATASTGTNYGVYGRTSSTEGRGVYGDATATSGANYGVYGRTSSAGGTGIYGLASNTAGITYGGYFEAQSFQGTGVYGRATATGAGATPYGVAGYCNTATAGYAVYAAGDMGASGTKSFRIDHPHDPEHKYLLHYSIESPEVLNAYSGKVTLDASGQAVVELPAYFASINKDPRYTLTAVGAPMPDLHVAEEISEEALAAGEQAGPGVAPPRCSFRIAGGVVGAKVCWEVKAVRNDLRMRLHGAPVEREKTGLERGRYQHPEYYRQPAEMGMDYQPEPHNTATTGSDAPAGPQMR